MTQLQNEPKQPGDKPDTQGILRRNNRGCKSSEFYSWPDQPLDDMDSPLAVQQYIQQTIRKDPSDVDEILKLPEGQDLGAWKIEHLRLFCMQLNRLAARLQECCEPETCKQMTATEQWIFLCAAHKTPNECPAIDYVRHTLDGAASLLNSNKYFPSRVTIKESSVAKLGSVCRRIYRIFSHAYYHHYQEFDEFERETHLCKRFSRFVTIYDLMSKEQLIVPDDGSKPELGPTVSESANTTVNVAPSTPTTTPITSTPQDTSLDSDTKEVQTKPAGDSTNSTSTKLDTKVDVRSSNNNPESSQPNVANYNTMVKGSKGASDDSSSKALNSEKTVISNPQT